MGNHPQQRALAGAIVADQRDTVAEAMIATVERYAPGFAASVVGRQVLSPLDLEREFGLLGGDIFHGKLELDQLFSARPVLGHGAYRGPLPGLYLCGAGTHPGGGVTGAERGTLAVMASGPRADVAAVEPLLKVICKVFFLGERPGAGQTMKLVNNVLSAAAMTATAEALVTGFKAGLDPHLMLDVINAGTGRNTMTEDKVAKAILPGTFDLGFTAGLLSKDVNLFLAEREALGVTTNVIDAVAAVLKRTCDELGPEADVTAVIQPIENRAGVKVRAPAKKP